MKIITAPEPIENKGFPTVFLAGGITNCPLWQDKIIKILDSHIIDENVTLFNPRRKNFPINDPSASYKQIEWEFNALKQSDIFSIWFSSGSSDQPICMYELGQHITKKPESKIVIGVDPYYKRKQDVYIQVGFVSEGLKNNISDNLEDHAKNIVKSIQIERINTFPLHY